MDDIARIANVSKPTVSRALNGSNLVTAKTRQRVLSVARAHGYAVNRNAKKLRSARSSTVAVILDFRSHGHLRIADPFIFELLAGVSEALSLRNQDLLLSPAQLSDNPENYLNILRSKVVDGFIFLGLGERFELLKELSTQSVPMVVWGAVTEDAPFCAVGSDNFYGGVLAGKRFKQLKKKRILFVGNIAHHEIALRFKGIKSIFKQAKGKTSLQIVDVRDFSFATTFTAVRRYLERNPPPDGVFAYSDTAAMATISALREENLTPPDDYSIIGYNDIPPAAHFSPAITTIRQDTIAAGSLLVEKFMEVLEGQDAPSVTIPTELIIRDT